MSSIGINSIFVRFASLFLFYFIGAMYVFEQQSTGTQHQWYHISWWHADGGAGGGGVGRCFHFFLGGPNNRRVAFLFCLSSIRCVRAGLFFVGVCVFCFRPRRLL